MKIVTQIHMNDFVSDESDGTGDMSMNGNIFIDVQGATVAEKQTIQAVLRAHYQEIREELKKMA